MFTRPFCLKENRYMATIYFCGDPHGRFDHLIQVVTHGKPDAIILLGDLTTTQPLQDVLAPILGLTEVWFIHGNHDTDSEPNYDHLFSSALADRNLHGRVVEIAGVRIAGLGGVFRRQVWMPPAAPSFQSPDGYCAQCGRGNLWRGGLPRKHRSTIFPADFEHLKGQHADILVTHEAPSCHPHGFQVIDDLARDMGVTMAFHGHHHDHLDYSPCWADLGFQAYGVGLQQITDNSGAIIG